MAECNASDATRWHLNIPNDFNSQFPPTFFFKNFPSYLKTLRSSHLHLTAARPQDGGEFGEWDAATQGLVLGSFFLGYAASSLAGGRGSEHLGGRRLFGAGIVASSLLALLSPTCARASPKLFAVVRMLQGAAQVSTLLVIISVA